MTLGIVCYQIDVEIELDLQAGDRPRDELESELDKEVFVALA